MADVPTLRSMEDFLINPTFDAMDDRHRSPASLAVDGCVSTSPPVGMFSLEKVPKTPEASATMRSFVEEPFFWRGYTSEEEVASPVEADDLSFRSATSPSPCPSQLGDAPFSEPFAQGGYRVEQQCSKAQAITFVSAGKARIVSLPKAVVDSPTVSRPKRPATDTSLQLPRSRFHSGETDTSTTSFQNSPRALTHTSSEKSPVSTPTSSIAEQPKKGRNMLRRRPSLPVLAATARFHAATASPLSTFHSQSTDFLNHDPFPSAEQMSPPMTPTKRKLHKFSSSLGLGVLAKGAKSATSPDGSVSEDIEAAPGPEPILATTLAMPARRPSTRTKMIPRGANERAPPIVLPPCPESYDEDENFVFRSTASNYGPARKVSKSSASVPKSSKLHRRQRSYSTAWITSQA